MKLPEREWITIPDLVDDLKISASDVEYYLKEGQLTASFYCYGTALLSEVTIEGLGEEEFIVTSYKDPEPAEIGIYDILSYRSILWERSSSDQQEAADINLFSSVYLHKEDKYYATSCAYTINRSDLIITTSNIMLFRSICDNNAQRKAAFDPKEFIEMSLLAGKSKNEIIVELVETHCTDKTKHYGTIARTLFSNKYAPSSNNAVWRKRGSRVYEKAKKTLESKNDTLSLPSDIP